jgi:hypothetical protein
MANQIRDMDPSLGQGDLLLARKHQKTGQSQPWEREGDGDKFGPTGFPTGPVSALPPLPLPWL